VFCLLALALLAVTVKQTHDVLQPVLYRQLQADAVAPRELQGRTGASGVIDRTNGVYDVLPVVKQQGQAVSGLFAARVIGSFGIRAERAAVTVALTLEGYNPRSCEPRLSGNHLGSGLVTAS
jgi:hypothetical protein